MDTQEPVHHDRSNKIVFWILSVALFLIPLFFIPSASITFQFAKSYLIFMTVIVGAMIWIVSKLKEGVLTFPRNWIFWLFPIIPLLFTISAFFSKSRVTSFIGNGYEVGTVAFIAILFLLTYLISDVFRTTKAIVLSYCAYLGSFVFIALFHLLRLIVGPQFLAFNQFTSSVSSIIGSWNDAAIYFGSVALFALITLELLKVEKWLKVTFIAILTGSIFLLTVISFSAVWYVLAIFSLIFFIYNFSFNKSENSHRVNGTKKLPILSLVILIISIVFILIKGNIYNSLANAPFNISVLNRFNISNVEVRPSVISTSKIAWQSIKQHTVVGVGPNRFVNQWLTSKPLDINNTIFWSTDFNYGFGLIPTFLVTAGPIAFLAWIAFFALFIIIGFKAMFTRRSDPFKEYLMISSFLISLYFWIFTIVYIPSSAILFLTFFFTGVFLASIRGIGIIEESRFEFTRDPRISFASVLIFVVLLLIAIISGYGITRRFVSMYYYNQALIAGNVSGNVDVAQTDLIRAIQFSGNDNYYRTLSQLYLVKLNKLLSNTDVSKDVLQSQFRTLLAQAQASAQAARDFDKTNYQNWLSLGNVLGSVVSLNVDGAYEGAKTNYEEALKLNPTNPAIFLSLAQLEAAHNNTAGAKEDITKALNLKGDYTDAIFYLAQIQVAEGDLPNAIKSLEASTIISPNDAGLYFQLGLLRYNNKDYTGAVSAFEQSLTILPDYANAKYFLGLAYSKANRTADALKLFEDLATTNADNEDIKKIVANLKAGLDPLAGFTSPQNQPEKSTTPPIKDSTTTKTDTKATTATSAATDR